MTQNDLNNTPLSIQQVTKKYADGFEAVRDVSFTIKKGTFSVLMGLNGAGKTSLIGMLTGLNHITKGTIKVFGADIIKSPYQAKLQMGIVPQEINLNLFMPILDTLVYHGGFYGIPKHTVIERAMPLLKKARLDKKIHAPVASLSGGMKRMLMLIRALIQQPKILILDEPTANLDIEIRRTIWDILRAEHSKGMTTLLTTHNLEEAQILCTNVLILHQGKLIMDRTIEEAIEEMEEKFYTIKFTTPVQARVLEPFSAYNGKLRDEKTADFCINRSQDIGQLVYKLHLAGFKLEHISPASHQLEQLLTEAIL